MQEIELMILIVASNKDMASLNIKKQILHHYHFIETSKLQENATYTAHINGKNAQLITLNQESIYAQNLTALFREAELVIFISKHSSASGRPTLSVHTPGNLGQAELGGNSNEVSVSPANAMRDALKTMAKLREEMQLKYEVSYEGTHHGPSLNVPTMFAELGSSPAQWNDSAAAEVVARAAMEAASKFGNLQAQAVLGIGGPHYNLKFTRMALENQIAFGHMIPKHSIPEITQEIIQQCVEKTSEKVDRAVLDWKGTKGNDKPRLIGMLDKIGLPIQKV